MAIVVVGERFCIGKLPAARVVPPALVEDVVVLSCDFLRCKRVAVVDEHGVRADEEVVVGGHGEGVDPRVAGMVADAQDGGVLGVLGAQPIARL